MNNENNIEIEYKYKVLSLTKEDFQTDIENRIQNNDIYRTKNMEPLYVCSCDDYYISDFLKDENEQSFIRYRKSMNNFELTLKKQRTDNTVRKEINLNLQNNTDSSIVEFLKLSGYRKQFSIFKEAWIWCLDDCDISYYTLFNKDSYIEIEAKNYSNIEEGLTILSKYDQLVTKGYCINNQIKRETRSLYQIMIDGQNGV